MKTTIGRRLVSLAVFCSILISLDSSANTPAYKPRVISDVETITYENKVIMLGDRSMRYSVSYQQRNGVLNSELYESHSPNYIESQAKSVWATFLLFMDKRHIPTEDCREDYNLNFFILERRILFDSDRFVNYFINIQGTPLGVNGFYDSTLEVEANSAIVLTNLGQDMNTYVFAHEFAHYWYDRLCVGRTWQGTEEDFAVTFEEFYREER